MKNRLFLFSALLCAMFLIVSCDKEAAQESVQTDVQADQPFSDQQIKQMIDQGLLVEDVRSVDVLGFTFEVGKKYKEADLPAKVLEEVLPETRSKKRSTGYELWTHTYFNHTGTSSPTLGQELRGLKGSSFIQVASVSQSLPPSYHMVYHYDAKNLKNVSIAGESFHRYRHYSYNNEGTLTVTCFCKDLSSSEIWAVDADSRGLDDYCDVSGWRVWSEAEESNMSYYLEDETAVKLEYFYAELCAD